MENVEFEFRDESILIELPGIPGLSGLGEKEQNEWFQNQQLLFNEFRTFGSVESLLEEIKFVVFEN